ncbi:MAG: sulfatase-like hydrolase/transferase [Chitinivibrionales bacterium]|nr:sulfatase-like hydrolase/transferase [Chitinivibrionales bacterium]
MSTQTRRKFLKQCSAGLSAAAVSSPIVATAGTAQQKPNIIFILCDDMGYGDLGCFGHPDIQSPNLDKLAEDGITLTDCYAAAPVCSPARSGAMTGRIPHRTGIKNYISKLSDVHLNTDEITVAELLKDAGYTTCLTGKWHLCGKFRELDTHPMPDDQGFDYYFGTENNSKPTHHNPGNFYRNGVKLDQLQGYSSDLIVDEAIDWLDTKRDTSKPFFLYVAFHSPHEPIATAPEFKDMYSDNTVYDPQTDAYTYREYFGNVTQMDYATGRLLDYLDAEGLRDNTFVMFTSDNGPETYDRYNGSWYSVGSAGPLKGRKLQVHEGGIRVPGIVRWPGQVTPGSTSSEPINGVDLLPTLCEIAGSEVPQDRAIDGASFLPVFEGNSVDRTTPLFWEFDYAEMCPEVVIGERTDCEMHAGEYGWIPTKAVRMGDWKLLANRDYSDIELYNLSDDIGEENNLVDDYPQRVQEMLDIMKNMVAEVNEEGNHDGPIIYTATTVPLLRRNFRNSEKRVEIFTMSGKRVAGITTKETVVPITQFCLPYGSYIAVVNGKARHMINSRTVMRL